MFPTIEIVKEAEKHGYYITKYQQQQTRNPDDAYFTKHMVRLRHQDVKPVDLGDTFPEIVITNGHNRTTPLSFMLGFFRLVCLNGMVTGDVFDGIGRIRHTHSNPFAEVLKRINEINEYATKKVQTIKLMSETILTSTEQDNFAFDAANLTPERTYEEPRLLNTVNRNADIGDNLWHTFNRVQENLVKGHAYILDSNGNRRKTKRLTAIDKTIEVNRKLWKLAESYIPDPVVNEEQYTLAA